ncbi:MAG: FtsH protease activity modulator HflK [Alphaproteobacteria bacterium]|nr:FtsH protease activity modulator HflK [Alphaproteobacteria bacterium]
MSYKQQGGGPWGGGGGPWGGGGGGGGGGGNPWGGSRGNPPPDLEDLIRKSQDSVRRLLPGGIGGGRGFMLAGSILLGLWGLSGIYTVAPDEQGVELMFGRFIKTTAPGINYWFPAPIGEVIKPKVTQTNQITVGFRTGGTRASDVPQESMILTGDENIVDMKFTVQWRIRDAGEYLFNMRDVESTIKIASESAVREIVGGSPLQAILADQREVVAQKSEDLLQQILDGYKAGVTILDLQIQNSDPPKEVIDAFNDVQRAKQDQERLQNEANAYRNDIVPRAKGEASRMVQAATAQKEKLIREAEGQAERFNAFYDTYVSDKDITARRMYLEAMQEVLGRSEKIIVDENSKGSGVVPYLPLPEIQKRSQPQPQSAPGGSP